MFSPSGVVYPIGAADPCMTNVLSCPVGRVSCSIPPLPEASWNSARLPSGDQAIRAGAVRSSGQLASSYLVPPGLMRYSISGPDMAPGPGGAVVYCARTHPAPTWLHGTLARAVPPAAAAPAVVPAASRTALRRAVMVREVRHALMPSWTPPGRAR